MSEAAFQCGTRSSLGYLIITPRISAVPYPANQELGGSYLGRIPMGIAYISATMKMVSDRVFNLNLELEPLEVTEAIQKTLIENPVQVVLTGGMSGQFRKIKQVVDTVKSFDPKIMVIVGGGVMTPRPQIAMTAFENVDIGVIGEGEYTCQELVHCLDSGGDLSQVHGIIYKKGGDWIQTPTREEIKDLDALPYPDYYGLGIDKTSKTNNTAIIVASRSCPFRCTFCYHPCGPTYRRRSIDSIVGEASFLIENFGVTSIGLFDELFVSDHARVEEFCQKIKPFGITWGATVHASTYQKSLLYRMRDAGCTILNLGVESASEKVLRSMRKNTNFGRIEQALRDIRDAGIGCMASMIFGDLEEDKASVDETLSWWRNNLEYSIELTRLYVYPGSEIYNQSIKMGLIANEIEHLKNDCRDINISKLSDYEYRDMLLRLTTEEAFHTYAPMSYSVLKTNLTNGSTQVSYTCKCGHQEEITTTGLLLSNSFKCPLCFQGYRIPYHKDYSFDSARDHLENLISQEGEIAFWGLGREMQLLIRGLNLSTLDGVTLIDMDQRKQGLHFQGALIHSPNILKERDIRIVIPSPLLEGGIHHMGTIADEVKRISSARILPFGEILRTGIQNPLEEPVNQKGV